MHIIIIGAGLGGLTAAYAFARNHKHDITVLERSTKLSPQGSGLNTRPGATRLLHSWLLESDMRAISDRTPTVLLRDLRQGGIAMRSVLENASEVPDWGTHRTRLIEMLYGKAVEAGAQVRFGETVVGVSENGEEASVALEGGETVRADLVLCADGIRSRTRAIVLKDLIEGGVDVEPIVSDATLYGTCLPAETVLGSPVMAKALTDNNAINVYMGEKAFVVGRYNSTLGVYGGLFGIRGESSGEQKGLWDENGDIEWVRKWYRTHGLCNELMAVLEMSDSCDRWKLAEMPNLPRWSSTGGRLVLLGDSAHGMHPNAAQGYSMIVESIGVLEFLFDRAGSEGAKSIPQIIKTWEEIRKPRVERIKEYAQWNTAMFTGEPLAPKSDVGQSVLKDLRNVTPNMSARFNSSAFVKWTLDYDAVEEARKYVERVKARL